MIVVIRAEVGRPLERADERRQVPGKPGLVELLGGRPFRASSNVMTPVKEVTFQRQRDFRSPKVSIKFRIVA
ncbi:hypothetical protein AB0D67_04610 [Streptosporangium sp. NPDC048047]|uniref:hypothetical protein n=1 Tax=Streptosporangium sp. NPDC048047 TaxID=3155748 RepID=UPI0034378278